MIRDTFERQILILQGRVDELRRRADEDPARLVGVLPRALEALQASLEELHVAQEELRQQNEELIATRGALAVERTRYQALLEFAPDGYLVTDGEGVIREANRAASLLLGVAQSFLVGKLLVVYIAQRDRRAFEAQITRMQDGECLESWEIQLQPREGEPFSVTVSVSGVRDGEGRLASLHWLLRDITGRKQAQEELGEYRDHLEELVEERTAELGRINRQLQQEVTERTAAQESQRRALAEALQAMEALRESEERYRSLFERVPVGLFRTTPEGHIIDANPAMVEMFGYSDEESLKAVRASGLYVNAEDRSRWQEVLALGGEMQDYDKLVRRSDGTNFWMRGSTRIVRDHDGPIVYYEGVLADITEHRRGERLLQALNQAALAMEQALTPAEIFSVVARELRQLNLSCIVFRTDEEQESLTPIYFGFEPHMLRTAERLVGIKASDFTIPIQRGDLYQQVIRERKTVFHERGEEIIQRVVPGIDSSLAGQILTMLNLSRGIVAPLVLGAE